MRSRKRNIALTALLLLAAAANAQPRELADISLGVETVSHFYITQWVFTGDTIGIDTTDNDGVIYLLDGFWITSLEMTQDYWQWYMHSNPSAVKGDLLPVTNITRQAADSMCNEIHLQLQDNWRLPTLEEWLFAFHGGVFGEGYRYAGSDKADNVAWNAHNSRKQLHGGGRLISNELGIHDMSGNVAEMVTDGDRTLFVGGSYVDKLGKTAIPIVESSDTSLPPECRGLRLVKHEPLWFNIYNEKVYRRR